MKSSVGSSGASKALRSEVNEQLDIGIASKRARAVAQLILDQGSCTTSDLESLGYKHAPRAVRDLRDAGIDVGKHMESYVDSATGSKKRRARYVIEGVRPGSRSRRTITKQTILEVKQPGRCEICRATPPLQVDHRIPFDIGGESYPHVVAELMPLCPSCNRAKSWECENCDNRQIGDKAICATCFWASPNKYTHVATRELREIRVVLYEPDDIRRYDIQRPDATQVISDFMRDAEVDSSSGKKRSK